MTRIVTSANDTSLAQASVAFVLLAELNFASGTLYCTDGPTEITWNGHTYLPTAGYGSVDMVQEDTTVLARAVRLTLSGVDAGLVGTAQTEVYQNKSVVLYLAVLDMTTNQVAQTPEQIWEGRMDTMTISADQAKGSIVLNCEHRLMREPRIARYTDQDQQLAFTGDTFFDQTSYIQNYVSQWGQTPQFYAAPNPNNPRVVLGEPRPLKP